MVGGLAAWAAGELARRTEDAAHSLRTPPALPAESAQIDVEDLHLLRAVADHGSINRAAAVLSISQSALTRRIHRLELRLGASLLVRSSRGTDLTAPTRQFLDRLASFEAELHAVGLTGQRDTVPPAEPGTTQRRAHRSSRGAVGRPGRAERGAARPAVAGRG